MKACSTFVAFFALVSRNGTASWSANSCRKKKLANQSKLHLWLVDTIKVSVITVGILQELFKGTDLVLIKQCKTHFMHGSLAINLV